MAPKQVTVTEAVRNFAELVSRVHHQEGPTILVKRGMPMVKLSPAKRPKTGRELAALWKKRTTQTSDEAASFERDIADSRRRLGPLVSEWE